MRDLAGHGYDPTAPEQVKDMEHFTRAACRVIEAFPENAQQDPPLGGRNRARFELFLNTVRKTASAH
jgi:hypothetical protein